MPYASGRSFFDADSHIMERPDFLRDFAEEPLRERIPQLSFEGQGKTATAWDELTRNPGHTPERVAEMVALGDGLIAGPKGFLALGAFNREERTQALDQLGFHRQLVFTTMSSMVSLHHPDPEILYAGAASHNQAMANFCEADPRLMGVAALPLVDPDRSLREAEHLIELGLRAAWVPHKPCGGRSPGHDDLDPVWARLAEAGVPFVLHVGGNALQLPPEWLNTGRPIPTDWQGGGENVRGKDMLALHHQPETFLGAMIFDGVFERHRALRGAAVELGAGWVPSWMRRLDWSAHIWRKEPDLAALTRKPSEIVREHLAFTPFVYEDVGQLIRESDDGLYLFSSDYPHYEGSKNPIERFEGFLGDVRDETRDRFYSENFVRVFGA